jgi:hypothetical protein
MSKKTGSSNQSQSTAREDFEQKQGRLGRGVNTCLKVINSTWVTKKAFKLSLYAMSIGGMATVDHMMGGDFSNKLGELLDIPRGVSSVVKDGVLLGYQGEIEKSKVLTEHIFPVISSAPEYFLYAFGVSKFISKTIKFIGEDPERSLKLHDNSVLQFHLKALLDHDPNNRLSKPDTTVLRVDSTAFKDQMVVRALNHMRSSALFGEKRGGYHQGEVNMLHAAVLMKLGEHVIPGAEKSVHSLKGSKGFKFAFENAERLGKALEGNVNKFSAFANSLYRATQGYEKNMYDLDSLKEQHPSIRNAEKLILKAYNEQVTQASFLGQQEAQMRSVMKTVVNDVADLGFEASSGNGKNLVTKDAKTLLQGMRAGVSTLKAYDGGHHVSLYAQLYAPMEQAAVELERAINNAEANGQGFFDTSAYPELEKLTRAVTGQNAKGALWGTWLPHLDINDGRDSLSAKHLLISIERNLELSNNITLPESTPTPKDAFFEIAHRALVDYAHHHKKDFDVKHFEDSQTHRREPSFGFKAEAQILPMPDTQERNIGREIKKENKVASQVVVRRV